MRSTPTTCRTWGDDLGRVGGATRDIEHEHLRGERSQLLDRACRAAHERRIGSGEQPDLAGERIADDVVVVGHGDTVTVPRRGGHRVTGQGCGRSGRHASRLTGARGTWPEDADDLVTLWHTHELHQLLVLSKVSRSRILGRVTSSLLNRRVDPRRAPPRDDAAAGPHDRGVLRAVDGRRPRRRVRVISARAPVREMIVYATRWPINRPVSDPTADAFFAALALLASEWLETEAPLHLPTSTSPAIGAAMATPRRISPRRRACGVCSGGLLRAVPPPPIPSRDRHELAGVPHHELGSSAR